MDSITITLQTWWVLPAALGAAPFIYSAVTERGSGYGAGFDVALVALVCWPAAIGLLIGSFIG